MVFYLFLFAVINNYLNVISPTVVTSCSSATLGSTSRIRIKSIIYVILRFIRYCKVPYPVHCVVFRFHVYNTKVWRNDICFVHLCYTYLLVQCRNLLFPKAVIGHFYWTWHWIARSRSPVCITSLLLKSIKLVFLG